jgi:6-pyruvoyltetrahydropterin/6-carboxytetrahydropterin synthase
MTITKKFTDYPAGHRQHRHAGHCSQVHGHDWAFEMTFYSSKLDECGFILDFGGPVMKKIKALLTELYDHTLLINADDPLVPRITEWSKVFTSAFGGLRIVPDCSCEGIAQLTFMAVQRLLDSYPDCKERGVVILAITVFEDSKNSSFANSLPPYPDRKKLDHALDILLAPSVTI